MLNGYPANNSDRFSHLFNSEQATWAAFNRTTSHQGGFDEDMNSLLNAKRSAKKLLLTVSNPLCSLLMTTARAEAATEIAVAEFD
jgi:glycine cleavage system pyridoxal-binding protein P